MKPRPQPHKPTNRIHSESLWPTDPLDMARMAKSDVEFVEVMQASRFDSAELRRIARVAQDRLEWAASKLGSKGKPK